jgi:acetyltransferase EpsM
MDVWLIQAGGHCKQCIDILLDNSFNILGIFDNFQQPNTIFYRGIKVVGDYNSIMGFVKPSENVFCTIGDNIKRKQFIEEFPVNVNWINCISKYAIISPSAKIGVGNYVGATSKILSDTIIGNFNIINDGATLMHDDFVGNFCHLCPNSSVGGKVSIGNCCLIGTNSTINPNISIQDNIIVGSGAVLVKNITENNCTVVGVPAKKL